MRERLKQWWQKPSSKWWVMGAIALLGMSGGWLLPDYLLKPNYSDLTNTERATLAHQYRGTLIGGIGTIATVVAGVFLFLNFRIANKNARNTFEFANKQLDLDTQKIAQDSALVRDRLSLEQFAKAVEQVGNENSIHSRLGGIYLLGQLAEGSIEIGTVLDVLSAFIREKHLKVGVKKGESEETSSDDNSETVQELATDVKAAFTVIWKITGGAGFIDLTNTDFHRKALYSVSLSNADLRNASFVKADLRFTNFIKADLRNANLLEADLSHADLRFTLLSKANLSNTIMLGSDFRHCPSIAATQFTTKNPPLLCNIALPKRLLDAGIDPNRDCDRIPQILSDRYNIPLEEAERQVEAAKRKQWD